ncbi:UPF0175 family protein [Candidatus Harpocratesius sp.]
MSERLSIIIPKKLKEDLNGLKTRMHLDQSTLIRKLLTNAIKEEKLNHAIKEYQKEKISLGNAAELAEICLWEFIDELKKHKIFIELNSDEIDEEIDKILSGEFDQFI